MKTLKYAVYTRNCQAHPNQTWSLVAVLDLRSYVQQIVAMLNKTLGHIQEYQYRELINPINLNIEVKDLKTL